METLFCGSQAMGIGPSSNGSSAANTPQTSDFGDSRLSTQSSNSRVQLAYGSASQAAAEMSLEQSHNSNSTATCSGATPAMSASTSFATNFNGNGSPSSGIGVEPSEEQQPLGGDLEASENTVHFSGSGRQQATFKQPRAAVAATILRHNGATQQTSGKKSVSAR